MQGTQANVVVPAISTLAGRTPRSWNLSCDGTLIAVGFEDGALQVCMIHTSRMIFILFLGLP